MIARHQWTFQISHSRKETVYKRGSKLWNVFSQNFLTRFQLLWRDIKRYFDNKSSGCVAKYSVFLQEKSLPCIDKVKYLVPKELSVAQLATIVRNRLSLNQSDSFFLFTSGGTLVTLSMSVENLHMINMDQDGFLYIEYASQETFGT